MQGRICIERTTAPRKPRDRAARRKFVDADKKEIRLPGEGCV